MGFVMKAPSQEKSYIYDYSNFKGIDFSRPPESIGREYLSFCNNIFLNENEVISSRWGEINFASFENEVIAMFSVVMDGISYLYIVSGGNLIEYNLTDNLMGRVVSSDFSEATTISSFKQGRYVWLLDGNSLRRMSYEGKERIIEKATDLAYIPTTHIASTPNGEERIAFESVNMLSPYRKVSFRGDGSSRDYKLDCEDIDEIKPTVFVNGKQLSSEEFSVNYLSGWVSFATAPAAPEIIGQDNVVIKYSKLIPDSSEKIGKCTISTSYGLGGDLRMFVSGNEGYIGVDWHSAHNNPAYFPESSESFVSEKEIIGYLQVNYQQAIILKDSTESSNVFFRTAKFDESLGTIFIVEQGVFGKGAVSKTGFCHYRGEPHYLGGDGVYSITSNSLNLEKSLYSKSGRINPMLKAFGANKLPMDRFCLLEYKDYLFLSTGEELFLGDGRFESGELRWYRWTGLTPTKLCVANGKLFWADASNRLHFFEDGLNPPSLFVNSAKSYFSTKIDNDGSELNYKSLVKDGVYIKFKSFGNRLKVSLILDEDRVFEKYIEADEEAKDGYGMRGVFLQFRGGYYKTARIIVETLSVNAGFELYALIKKYSFKSQMP